MLVAENWFAILFPLHNKTNSKQGTECAKIRMKRRQIQWQQSNKDKTGIKVAVNTSSNPCACNRITTLILFSNHLIIDS